MMVLLSSGENITRIKRQSHTTSQNEEEIPKLSHQIRKDNSQKIICYMAIFSV